MEEGQKSELINLAREVLKNNDRGIWTVPAGDLYPHQWLWDSCFIAIGLRHQDIERAQTELKSLLRGQWANGMLPNIIFSNDKAYKQDRNLWRSWINPYSPDKVSTSGITQPPMLAEAVVRIGQKLKITERRSWYRQMYPALLSYHQWLYAERDPHHEGLIILVHPYECGMDSTPPWNGELRKRNSLWWLTLIEQLHLDKLINLVRRDTRHTSPGQRMTNIEALAYWAAMRRLRRKAYNSEAILDHSLLSIEDLGFNCIFIRANEHLREIAKTIGQTLPKDLEGRIATSQRALEQLWDEVSGQYYCRNFINHKLIEESTIATLLPLYAGCITKERAAVLVEMLKKRRFFKANWPAPSVPLNSPYFDPFRYWQGPTWVNTNWLIIDGLKRYGFNEEAATLKDSTLKMVFKSGCAEYFNPLTGEPAGAKDFSWTAALTIDLLKS